MIDESLLKSGFAGKDGFSWWIGRVAHQDYWKNTNQALQNLGEMAQRVKVRIVGYHPWDDTLPESELPWAHVSMDAITGGGQGTRGDTLALVGGETAIGFFLDGEEAQQPVIIGLLHRSANVADTISESEISSSGSSQFKNSTGFPGGKAPATARRKVEFESRIGVKASPGTVTNTGVVKKPNILDYTEDGIVDRAAFNAAKRQYTETGAGCDAGNASKNGQAACALEDKATKEVIKPDKCGKGAVSDIATTLENFIAFTNALEKDFDDYINPLTNEIVDMTLEIKRTAKKIAGVIKKIINSARTGMIKKIMGAFQIFQILNKKFNPLDFFLGPAAKKAFVKIIDIVWCLFQKIFGDIWGFLLNMLENMITRIINGPFCAVEQFVAGILNKLFSMLENFLQPILDGISWLLGGLGSVMDMLNQASSFVRQILDWLACTGVECTPTKKWKSSWAASILGPSDQWQKTIEDMNFMKGISKGIDEWAAGIGTSKIMKWFNGEDTEEAKDIEVNGTNILDLLNTVKKLTGGKIDPTNILGGIDGAIGSLSIFGNGNSAYSACDEHIWNPKTQYDLISIPIGHTHWTCIPPISEINGTGFGAVTKPIVDAEGRIFSIEVVHGGSGYETNTTIAIIDRTNHGSGARGKVIVENGSVKEVVLLQQGSGYCGGDNSQLLIDIPKGSGGIGTSVVGVVTSVYVDRPGIGYTPGDTVTIDGTTVPIRVTSGNGSIVYVDPTPTGGFGFSKRPRVKINSTTGFGAEIIPVMKYNVQFTDDSAGVRPLIGITSVIDCPPEDHVFTND